MSNDYLKEMARGQNDAQAGQHDIFGGITYQAAHQQQMGLQRPAQTGGYVSRPIHVPKWVRAVAKWTGLLGLFAGAVFGYQLVSGDQAPAPIQNKIIIIAVAALVGGGVGWILPIAILALVLLALQLLVGAFVLAVILALIVLAFLAVKYIGGHWH